MSISEIPQPLQYLNLIVNNNALFSLMHQYLNMGLPQLLYNNLFSSITLNFIHEYNIPR